MRKFLFLCLMASVLVHAQHKNVSIDRFEAVLKNTSGWIMVYSDSGLAGYLDANGNEIVPPIYASIGVFGEYQDNWAKVQSEDGHIGFIDEEGDLIVEAKYDEIGKFGDYKENWALVSVDNKYGFIDNEGNEIVKPVYAEIPLKRHSN
ncbi:MAG: hypothetical protein CFE23_05940 [Flavobacterium sp. BFFFF1]|uniref:WG repeat-containing protein n=1 Tax=unclassified Flavobacterium TaxID=196869 RepID=UPI000BCF337D|nr:MULTISPECIES: WG repeat-containing protein [unclassified Flavobacterium]OYU81033.1 MAG: hypothetical protein CFE23_05940 [Flavobacterium sp. BFFFF1]